MTRGTLTYTLTVKTGHEIAPTPSACAVDLDDLLQNGSCTVHALKEHIKGSLGFQALYLMVCGPNLYKSDDVLDFSPFESRCPDKMYFLNDSLYRHIGGDGNGQSLLNDKCDLNVLLSVSTLLGTPLSVTAAVPSVVPQPASASEISFEVVLRTLTGKTLSFQVYGSTKVEELKQMVQDTEGIPPDMQRMLYGNKQMEDKQDLADYGVDGKDKTDPSTGKTHPFCPTIHLVLRLRGGMYHCTSGRLDNSELSKEPLTHTQLTVPIDNDLTGKKLVEQLQQHLAELEAPAPAGTTTA